MEVSNERFTIAVDDKQFVSHPEAKMTLDGAMAILMFATMTGEHKQLNFMLCQLLAHLMHEHKDKRPKGGWFDDKGSKW